MRFVLSPLLLLLRTFQSDIPPWLDQLSTVLTKDESPHTGYTFTPWAVSFTPLAQSTGKGDLDSTSHPRTILGIQAEEPCRCSVSEPGTRLGSPIWVLAQADDHLTSRKCPCSWPPHHSTTLSNVKLWGLTSNSRQPDIPKPSGRAMAVFRELMGKNDDEISGVPYL